LFSALRKKATAARGVAVHTQNGKHKMQMFTTHRDITLPVMVYSTTVQRGNTQPCFTELKFQMRQEKKPVLR